VGKHPQSNPNTILVPDKNRYGGKEPGELAGDKEGIPEWIHVTILYGIVRAIAQLRGVRVHVPRSKLL
jgi:hypothetical protein